MTVKLRDWHDRQVTRDPDYVKAMTDIITSWQREGTCVACGSPIYGLVRKNADPTLLSWDVADELIVHRTCPPTCPHGALVDK